MSKKIFFSFLIATTLLTACASQSYQPTVSNTQKTAKKTTEKTAEKTAEKTTVDWKASINLEEIGYAADEVDMKLGIWKDNVLYSGNGTDRCVNKWEIQEMDFNIDYGTLKGKFKVKMIDRGYPQFPDIQESSYSVWLINKNNGEKEFIKDGLIAFDSGSPENGTIETIERNFGNFSGKDVVNNYIKIDFLGYHKY